MSIVRIITALVAWAAATWLGCLLVTGRTVEVHWLVQAGVAGAAMLSSGLVALQQYSYWQSPAKSLEKGIRDVLAGEAAIEELSTIHGGLSELRLAVQDALRAMKSQRSQISLANSEMRQRVANRTDALERMLGAMKQQASRDVLTGLYNRRMLQQHLPLLVERCVADRTPLTVLMIDVDYFKQVNDTLGHATGDKLLTDIGQIIRSGLREEDFAFRCGGDEFVIVLPGQTKAQGDGLAGRLRGLMNSLSRTLHVAHRPGLSIGVASLEEIVHPTADALLAEADSRLYQVKKSRKPSRIVAA